MGDDLNNNPRGRFSGWALALTVAALMYVPINSAVFSAARVNKARARSDPLLADVVRKEGRIGDAAALDSRAARSGIFARCSEFVYDAVGLGIHGKVDKPSYTDKR